MQLKPVRQYQEPKLPTRQVIDENPELLRHVPRRWQTNPIVLSALAWVCTLMVGSRVLADKEPASVSKIAPVFEHGEGRASFGGIGWDRRTFLSEEEARKIIEDEASKAGISFVEDIDGVGGLDVPRPDSGSCFTTEPEPEKQTAEEPSQSNPEGRRVSLSGHMARMREEEGPLKELVFDGTDKKRSIHYEYVSEYDFKHWETRYHRCYSTVSSYDIHATAQALRDSLTERKPEGVYVVFYDPLVSRRAVLSAPGRTPSPRPKTPEEIRAQNEQMDRDIMQTGREELRRQVQDFIKWLKSQGVI